MLASVDIPVEDLPITRKISTSEKNLVKLEISQVHPMIKTIVVVMFLSHLATLHQDGGGVPMLTKMGSLVRRNKDE
jgi:hypothetical protein